MAIIFDRSQDPNHIKWAKAVKEKDNYRCVICGQKGGELHAHHIRSWDLYKDDRTDVENNGVTLCQYHHELFHSIYDKGKNTEVQFNEFLTLMRVTTTSARKDLALSGIVKEVISEVEKENLLVDGRVDEVIGLLTSDGYLESN